MSVVRSDRSSKTEAAALMHVAARLWTCQSLGSAPSRVTLLKRPNRKSSVVRLHGAGPGGRNVIAKCCPTELAERERMVYEAVLRPLPIESLRLYGVVDDVDACSWLFIEDAGDIPWVPELQRHRELAARWLASVHIGAAGVSASVDLPARGSAYYRSLLESARHVLAISLANDAVAADGREVLESLSSSCARLDAGWREVEELERHFPRTLTLPGLGRKNSRIREAADGMCFLAYDFESAGWGLPAADLSQVDLATYGRLVGGVWEFACDDLELLASLGKGLRSIKSITGEERTLASKWPEPALHKLAVYATHVVLALDALDAHRAGGRRNGG
jgi:hypothetical protein